MSHPPATIAELNALGREAFAARLGGLFEGTPQIAAAAWDSRPFASRAALEAALTAAMLALGPGARLALIRAHPDLAGRAAVAGDLTPESAREQASANLTRLTPEEFARFTALNEAYREKFGFPFVICVREHTRGSILRAFEARLGHGRDEEVAAALGEIAKIAALRLRDAVAEA